MRDLTDEEWLKLSKEEILQLYKNCYSMLMKHVEPSQSVTDEEMIKYAKYYANKWGGNNNWHLIYSAVIDTVEWLRSKIEKK
jgi:hypothetical protein